MPRFPLALVALTLVVSGCSSKAETPQALQPSPDAVSESLVPTTVPSARAKSPKAVPSTKAPVAKAKAPSYDVRAVKRQLTEQRYFVGEVNGEVTSSLRSAVMAFQKVNGLSADGGVGPKTLAALKAPKKPVLRGSGSGTRVEVDLTKQVLYVVKGGAITRILPVSSGNGARYLTKGGGTATALSPVGYYTIERRIVGERHADLGTLYDPQYFYKGWAIHGSNSVPAYPASHGCVRVTRTDAKYLLRHIGIGTQVYLYGGRHVFTAGSSAPGTDTPSGDRAQPKPTPTPTASAKPSAKPTQKPSPQPTGTRSPSPSGSPTVP